MARKLRFEYPGAMYHVLNRGNYRRGIFEENGGKAKRGQSYTLDILVVQKVKGKGLPLLGVHIPVSAPAS